MIKLHWFRTHTILGHGKTGEMFMTYLGSYNGSGRRSGLCCSGDGNVRGPRGGMYLRDLSAIPTDSHHFPIFSLWKWFSMAIWGHIYHFSAISRRSPCGSFSPLDAPPYGDQSAKDQQWEEKCTDSSGYSWCTPKFEGCPLECQENEQAGRLLMFLHLRRCWNLFCFFSVLMSIPRSLKIWISPKHRLYWYNMSIE